MTAATAKAIGTRGKGYVTEGRVRIAITIDESMFDSLKAAAIKNHHSIAEEMRRRLEFGSLVTAKERAA